MTDWMASHWWQIAIALVIVTKALNLATKHFSDYRGVVRWCLFFVDLLDVVKSSYGGVPGSRPPGPGIPKTKGEK